MRSLILGAAAAFLIASLDAASPRPAEPGDELPEGAGKDILRRACRSCHDLGEVTKFSGFWDARQWRDVVETMVSYGAKVNEQEAEVLADYLTKHLGRR